MSDFLLIIHETGAVKADQVEGYEAFGAKLREKKIWRDGTRLRPEAKRLSKKGIVDGPFTESKELIGGYYLFEAKNLDAALAIAKECPVAEGNEHELRPVMGSHPINERHKDGPGEIYLIGVMGQAKNEAAWTALMDRIDEKTGGDNVMPAGFVGGFRLEAPSTGKRITRKRGVIDGPFQESKEIVGGVCFVRASGMDEVIAWANKTAFLEDGTLEIRRLY